KRRPADELCLWLGQTARLKSFCQRSSSFTALSAVRPLSHRACSRFPRLKPTLTTVHRLTRKPSNSARSHCTAPPPAKRESCSLQSPHLLNEQSRRVRSSRRALRFSPAKTCRPS